jgi:predicted permease
MAALRQEIRHSLRVLAKAPSFSLVAILALALGIGANTAIFTVIHTVLLKPLPYPEPDRMVRVMRGYPRGSSDSTSIPKYMAWKRHSQIFEALAAYDFAGPGLNLAGDRPEQIKGIHVSAEFFRVFAAAPQIGRTFTADEDQPHGPAVAVLNHGLWKRRFGGDPGLIGKPIKLNDELFTIVGVMRQDFESYPPADVWLPLQADPNSDNQGHYLLVAGRLKPGVTVESAQAHMKVVAEQARNELGRWMNKDESIRVDALQEALTGNIRTALFILLGAVGLVLLTACANVANLLLARAAGRQREIAVRVAIGAGRWRLVRQLLIESVLLAVAGGALGLVLGWWGLRALLALMPGELPRAAEISLDPIVLAFTVGVSLVTALLFGLFPALQITKPDLASTLKESSSRSGTGLRHNRARSLLVITETALAVVLLIGAALLIRSFSLLRNTDPGFDTHNVLTMKLSLAGSKYSKTAAVENLFIQAVQRIEALPGVRAAAPSIAVPLELGPDMPITIEGRPLADGPYHGGADYRNVGSRYFDVLGIKLRRGRLFDDRDNSSGARVAIINEAMAKRYWPKQDPVGQRIVIGRGLGPQFEDPPRQIIGVVSDVREQSLEREPAPVMYIPVGQTPDGMTALGMAVLPMSLLIKTAGPPHSVLAAAQREIQAVDGQLAIAKPRSMEQVIGDSTARQTFNMTLLGVFAGIAVLLAAIGIYGLMAYSVEQRTQEIGIRMALGAKQPQMVRLIVSQGAKLAIAGVAVGVAGAYGLTRLLASLLYGIKPGDPGTFAGAALLLASIAVLAAYLPARRVTKVDPVVALRYE